MSGPSKHVPTAAAIAALLLTGCGLDSSPNLPVDLFDAARPDTGSGRVDAGVDADTLEPVRVETFLSDWAWSYENALSSAERDKSVNTAMHGDGNPIRLRSQVYEKGIGVAAPSDLRFNLDARCARFQAVVGIDAEAAGSPAEARAEVWVDGTRVFESKVLTPSSGSEEVDVEIRGAFELRLVVLDAGDPTSNHVDWANARVLCEEDWRGDAVFSYASDWLLVETSNGRGPIERDMSNGAEAEGDGTRISLDGISYEKGFGTQAPSEIEIDLAGHCQRFRASIGVDDDVTSGGSVAFQVWTDDELVFQPEPMTSTSDTRPVNIDLVGRSRLRLIVTDAGDGTTGDLADWADARLLCRTGWQGRVVETYVSDWVFRFAVNGFGPVERDMTNGDHFGHDGAPIRIDGETYARGLGVHAGSRIRLALRDRCTRFRADVGIDDDASSGGDGIGSVLFRVFGDGEDALVETPVKHFGDPPTSIDVDVSGQSEIELEANTNSDDSSWDHADWANARLTCEVGAIGL